MVVPMRTLAAQLHAAFHEPDAAVYRVVQSFVWAMIVLSIVLLILEAVLPAHPDTARWLGAVDRVVLVIFALEIVLRVLTYRPPELRVFHRPTFGRLRTHIVSRVVFLLRPMMLVDILAVLALFPELRGLRALRLLRLLRTNRVFRYRNPFAIVMLALEENGLLFTLAFGVLGVNTMLGGVSIYLVESKLNPQIESVFDGFWWALVTLTTVGFGDVTPVTFLGRVIGAVLMVAGMFTLAMFAGIVGSSLVRGMLSIREEQFRMSDYVNHIVVAGYDESTHLLLDALESELEITKTRVVLCDCHERPTNLPTDFLWVQGDMTKESELDKVRLTHAAAVIVTGERDASPQAADARTILTVFTVRRFLDRLRDRIAERKQPLYVVAEILDSENVDHAMAAGADEVIETRKIGYSMIAHAVGYHGTASTMSQVLLSGQHNVYIGCVPDPSPGPERLRDLLIRLDLARQGGLVIGVRTPEGKDVINPGREYAVQPGTQLIYLSEKALLERPG